MSRWNKNMLTAVTIAAALLGNTSDAAAQPRAKGSLVIVGSNLRLDETAVWQRIAELAGGKQGRIAVFPTASETPVAEARRVVAALARHGVGAFAVPLAVRQLSDDPRQVARDAAVVEQVRQSSGVYFVGGSQEYIVKTLRTPDGKNTPLLDAVWQVYRDGGVIVGCSAGAAVMSEVMFRDAPVVLDTLLHGVKMGQEIDRGLGFIDRDWFVDQHCLVRGRFARAIVAMHDRKIDYGIGIDENTAIVVTGDEDAEIVGYKGAVVIDLSQAKSDDATSGFNLQDIRLSYLDRGDRINLGTRKLTPSPEKRAEPKIEPASGEFRPYFDDILFTSDILGDMALADLMWKLVDNSRGEAIGLAFDAFHARTHRVPGFEFRFHRGADTVGWFTEAFGNDNYTVANIHLDIRPVRIGPLYEAGAKSPR
jgi:cyanophycinase